MGSQNSIFAVLYACARISVGSSRVRTRLLPQRDVTSNTSMSALKSPTFLPGHSPSTCTVSWNLGGNSWEEYWRRVHTCSNGYSRVKSFRTGIRPARIPDPRTPRNRTLWVQPPMNGVLDPSLPLDADRSLYGCQTFYLGY